MTDFLRNNYHVFFKHNGPGTSSTISMNGGKANEVALLWNGIRIHNPMLGLNDYSMIPIHTLTSLQVVDMAANSIYGAGAISGAISMHTSANVQNNHPHHFALGYNSMNQWSLHNQWGISQRKMNHRIQLTITDAKNNYSLAHTSAQLPRQKHAYFNAYNIQYDADYTINTRQGFKLAVWARKQYRQIPPLVFQTDNKAHQSDAFYRATLQYVKIGQNHATKIKGYLGQQTQNYIDPAINLDALHQFINPQLRLDNEWSPNRQTMIKYGFNLQNFTAQSDNYEDQKSQNITSGYLQYRYTFARFPMTLSALLKPEWVSDQNLEWISEFQAQLNFNKIGEFIFYGGRNVLFPTFNDIYWKPGGNPHLIPETNIKFGIQSRKQWTPEINTKIDFFHRRAENWIQWLPNGQFWSPKNFNDAKNYGIKTALTWQSPRSKMRVRYQWVRTFLINHPQAYKQTIYTPEHLAHIFFQQHINTQFLPFVEGEFTSQRYVLTDHSNALPAYMLWHTGISYHTKNQQWELSARLNNIFNKDYQGIINRPMPGLTFEMNIKYNFTL